MSPIQITGTDFVNLFTEDIARSEAFYTETLGLPVLKRYGKMPGVEFETGNLTIAVIQSDAFGIPFSPSQQPIAFQVDDVEAARAQLESEGVKFVADTIDSGVCHMAFFDDPDGNRLQLHKRYAPPTPSEAA